MLFDQHRLIPNARTASLDRDQTLRQMVAFIMSHMVLVREGYEQEENRLRTLAAELSAQRLERIQQQTAHYFKQPVRIRNVRVFDPHTLTLREPASVVFLGRTISSVQPADRPDSPGEIVIDGKGGTLIAGMFEMHGHRSQEQGPLDLATGITSVRDMGNANAGHVPAFGTADGMLDASYDELTHINQLMLGWVLKPDEDTRSLLRFTAMKRFTLLALDSAPVLATLKRITSRGVAVEPTVAIHEAGMLSRDGQIPVGQASYLEHMPIGYQRDAKPAWFAIEGPEDDAAFRAAFVKIMDTLRLMHQRGVLLIPGTDLGGSFAYHRELELFEQMGLTRAEVIRGATWDMARYLGADQTLGSIEPRKLADFFSAAWRACGIGIGLSFPGLSVLMLDLSPQHEQGRNSSALQRCDALATTAALALAGIAFAQMQRMQPGLAFAVVFAIAAVIVGLGAWRAWRVAVACRATPGARRSDFG